MKVRTLWAIHKWAGLVFGSLLFLVLFTGTVAVFKEEIDWAVTPALRVTPRDRLASIDDVLRAAGAAASGVVMPADPATAYTVYVGAKQVFVDPYTARVTGSREGEHLANVIRQAHARFYFFGWQGRVFVGFLGFALLASAVTGLLIYGPFLRGVFAQGKRWWQIREGFQLATSDWHKLIGVASLALNIVWASTGAVLGLENLLRYTPELSKTIHRTPSAKTSPEDRPKIGGDAALAAAKLALPGLQPTSLLLPSPKSGHYTIYGNIGGHFARHAANWALIGAYDGRTVAVSDSRTVSGGVRVYDWMEPLHFGDFAGTGVKLLYLLFALASSALPITGFVLWWTKRT
ncbi:MAG: PepSY-associated TM helix domain-containing protein [Bryobacteraceae bacterium]|nr:PepSY-associated TM helix domain-containing protein [Bryobacteraceae bacterium]